MAQMMIVEIKRTNSTEFATTGEIALKDSKGGILLSGKTLELPNHLCINKGEYNSKWRYSPHNKLYTPVLYNDSLKEDRYIEIHVGNTTKDTKGCILVGESIIYDNENPALLHSREFYLHFQFLSKFKPLHISIT